MSVSHTKLYDRVVAVMTTAGTPNMPKLIEEALRVRYERKASRIGVRHLLIAAERLQAGADVRSTGLLASEVSDE